MRYRYTGVTRAKDEVDGVVEANTEFEARLKLRAMQVRPKLVKKEQVPIQWQKLAEISIGPPIDSKGLLVFSKQFAALIEAGVAIVQCFEILAQQEKRVAFKKILNTIRADLEAGSSLAGALKKHSIFSNFYVSLVEAGEMSGTLETNLQRIVVQFEKMDRIKNKVRGAMIYPALTVMAAIGSMSFMLLKVIPEISKLYADANAKLPMLTLQVLALSDWMQANFAWMFVATIASAITTLALFQVEAVRVIFDPVFLRVPLLGDLIRKVSIGRFSRAMATLLSSGVPLLNAFAICQKLVPNRALRKVISETALLVSEGKAVAYGLGKNGKLFPPMVIHMVSIGEVTGKLDVLLDKVANIYEEEVDDAVSNLTTLIQPALIMVVGVLIAFLLVAMYLPIFHLAEKVSGAM